MLQPIKSLLEDKALFIAIAITIAIAYLSLSTPVKINLGLGIKSGDKYLHSLAYFALSLSWLFALRNSKRKAIKIYIAIVLSLYGIVLEVLQKMITNNRTADVYDELANITGILIGILVFNKFLRWFNTI